MPHDDAFDHEPPGCDAAALRRSIAHRLTYTIGKDPITATTRDWQHALAYVVRDRLTTQWMRTMRTIYRTGPKRVYYLSLEYLTGRLLHNSLLNMDLFDVAEQALRDLGLDFDLLRLVEPDAALGNGGLGRLAACLLDSMATLRLPGYAYGIRYDYGMFYQRIEQGQQVEHPENWLRYGNPWEFARPEVLYPVKFGGRVVDFRDDQGRAHHQWLDTEEVMAMAYDTPVPGYRNGTVLNLRLWSAKASRDFDLRYFNEGDYIKAVEDKNRSENLARVLYPVDTTSVGRELRLKQQYFFASASLQDILFRFTRQHGDLAELPDKAAIQLNDTHPAIAIAELMRLLVDVHEIEWKKAWELTQRTFAYTNHTLLPEALETWSVALFERLLPRHLQIIYDINHRHLEQVRHHFPGDGCAWPRWPASAATASTASRRSTPSCCSVTPSPTPRRCGPDASSMSPTASPHGAGCTRPTRNSPAWSARHWATAGSPTSTGSPNSPPWPRTRRSVPDSVPPSRPTRRAWPR
jgi:starch phosphorylase